MVMLKDIDGRTALHHAILEKNLAAITMLASKGVSQENIMSRKVLQKYLIWIVGFFRLSINYFFFPYKIEANYII